MAKQQHDLNPEYYLMNKGGYHNFTPYRPYHDEKVFRIDPAPVPWHLLLILNIVYFIGFGSFYWMFCRDSKNGTQAEYLLVCGAVVFIYLMTSIAVTGSAIYSCKRAQKLGPWLIYDKATGRVALPRENQSFEADEVVHLQYLSCRWTSNTDSTGFNSLVSELNLVTCKNGKRERWALLRSLFEVGGFRSVLPDLLKHMPVTVMRVHVLGSKYSVEENIYNDVNGL